jgi:uncharacterized protein YaiE (UPF0345 family)
MSISFQNEDGKATVGVMALGYYAFGTTTVEYMTVISGSKEVQLKNTSEWKIYTQFQTFKIDADSSFHVKVVSDTSYKCIYK